MRKLLALLITLALVFPFILSAQVLFSVNSFILDRNFYLQTLDNNQVYESLMSDSLINAMIGTYLPLPPDADLSKIKGGLESVITHEYLKEQIDIFVNGFFDYLQGKTSSFSPVVNLVPVKVTLSSEKQDELLAAIAAIIPVCEPGQMPGIDTANQNTCKTAGISDEILVKDYLKPVFPMVLAQIPDEVPIGTKWDELLASRNWGPFASGMALPASLMLISVFITFVAASFWYIASLIADGSWRVRLLWLGWTLMIPSALIFIIGLSISTDISNYWINLGLERVSFNNSLFGAGLRETLRVVVSGSLPRVASSLMMVSGISGAVSLGFIFWGLVTTRK
jgi:hypothetical protein